MNTNLIFMYKQALGNEFKIKNKKFKKTLKKPLIFFLILQYLDEETIFEVKYVCQAFFNLILTKIELDYICLKQQLKRIRDKKVFFIYFRIPMTLLQNKYLKK